MPISPMREWRERAGLTQVQAATAVGVSQPTISQIEDGRNTSLTTIRKLLELYKVTSAEAGALLLPVDGSHPAASS